VKKLFQLFVIGMLLAILVGALYYFLEWAWADYDDHDRGLFEGMLIITVYELGVKVAKHFVNRKDHCESRQADRA
jgi:uncharacterized membrane protein